MMAVVLSLKRISKSFPGVRAVSDMSLDIRRGEVLALLGENGAGKSTLMKIICGVLRADEGEIILDGDSVSFSGAHDAQRLGVGVVHQELSLIGSLSVAENIFMNNTPSASLGRVDWRALKLRAGELLKKFDLDIDPDTPVKRLSMGQKQMVEILKAISASPRVLILDEPSSSLTDGEAEDLFNLIRELKKDDVSFIYITHKLSEVFEIADRATIMRDGMHIADTDIADADEEFLVSRMVGREVKDLYGERKGALSEDVLLRVEKLSRSGRFRDVSFSLKRGEILGFSGLVGAGRTETALALFGADRPDGGTMFIEGEEARIRRPVEAIRRGIAYLTEDRKSLGLYLKDAVKDNMIAPNLKSLSRKSGVVDRRAAGAFVEKMMTRYNVAAYSGRQKVGTLSGGNQQKCLYSMWAGTGPRILILDEPTRGIDVGARKEMYRHIRGFAEEGGGVILISSDMSELMGLSDRIMVMHEGEVSGFLDREEFSEETILSLAAGLNKGEKS